MTQTKQVYGCNCCTTTLDRLAHLERTLRMLAGVIKKRMDQAEQTADEFEAQSMLNSAQHWLQAYRRCRTEQTTLLTTTQAECPTCGTACDWETFRNVDSCYACYRRELDGGIQIWNAYEDPTDVL